MRNIALQHVENKQVRKDIVQFGPGDTVRVYWKAKEGEKERVQPFEGVVIRKTEGGIRSNFTVRKVSYGVGVERIFPLHSPRYEKLEVLSRGSVNRGRLFYLRGLRGKASRVDVLDEQLNAPTSADSKAKKATPAAAETAPQA